MEPIRITFKFKDQTRWTEITLMRALSKIGPLNNLAIFIGNTQATLHISEPMQIVPFYEGAEALRKLNLELIETAEVKATRTVYIPRVQNFIVNLDHNLLKQLIHEGNNNLEPETLIFIGSATSTTSVKNNMKIVFKNANMAKVALQEGIWIDTLHIQPSNIKPEEIIRPPQCTICYKLDHKTYNCNNKGTTFCSRCTGHHSYTECDRNIPPLCINCKGNHSALYASCPEVKKAVNMIRKQKNNPNVNANNNNANNSNPQPQPQTPFPYPPPPPPPTYNAWFPNMSTNNANASQQIPNMQQPTTSSTTSDPQPTTSTGPNNINVTNNTTNPSAQPSNSQSQDKQQRDANFIDLQYDAYKTFAQEASSGDSIKYMKLMALFFKQVGAQLIVEINDEVLEVLKPSQTVHTASQTIINQATFQSRSIPEEDSESEESIPPPTPIRNTQEVTPKQTSTPKTPSAEASNDNSLIQEETNQEEDPTSDEDKASLNQTIISTNSKSNPNSDVEIEDTSSNTSSKSPPSSPVSLVNSQDTFGITPAQKSTRRKKTSPIIKTKSKRLIKTRR